VGLLIRRPSGGYETDVGHFLLMIYPEKGNLITDGIYRYIRHPRYLCRIIFIIGFCVLANSLIALGAGFIHLLIFYLFLKPEDEELRRRYSDEFNSYEKRIPALLPRYGNWKKFIKYVIWR
jgi:protein-S-isoprenylcysteine O-methyltransferase Ste14